MQRIEISHLFDGTPDDYLAVIDGAEFEAQLCQAVGLREHTVISTEDRGDHLLVRLRVVPERDMPGPVKAALGGKGMGYFEEEKRPKNRPWHREWTIFLDALGPNRFRCCGTFDLQPEAGGTRRTLRGEVEVKLLGVGGLIEKGTAKGITETYEKTSVLVREGLRRLAGR